MKQFILCLTVVLPLLALDIFLLWKNKLSGTDFVLFFTVITAIGFAIWFHSQIKELSFGGYIIKMKEENARAEELIKQLEIIAQDSFKAHMSRFSSIHESSPDHALHDAKAFVSCYEMYIKHSKTLNDEERSNLSSMVEAEIRKYLSRTLDSSSEVLYGSKLKTLPTPEELVRKWGINNDRFDNNLQYKFYRDKLFPLFLKHDSNQTLESDS